MLAWSGFIYAKIAKNAKFVEMSEDRKYLNGLANGSREAFEALYMKYAPLVERFAQALVKDASVAEDICQNVFLNLWNRRRNLAGKDNISAYLFASTRNAVADWFRRYAKAPSISLEDAGLLGFDPSGDIAGAEMLAAVNRCIAKMPLKRREVFLLSRAKGLKNAEIASLMGLSEKAVEYHISRALADLRKYLGGL